MSLEYGRWYVARTRENFASLSFREAQSPNYGEGEQSLSLE